MTKRVKAKVNGPRQLFKMIGKSVGVLGQMNGMVVLGKLSDGTLLPYIAFR